MYISFYQTNYLRPLQMQGALNCIFVEDFRVNKFCLQRYLTAFSEVHIRRQFLERSIRHVWIMLERITCRVVYFCL